MPDPFYAGQPASEYIPALVSLANGLLILSATKTTNFTAVKGYLYPLGANAITVTLPASASVGDRIEFFSTSDSYTSVTLGNNGLNINGVAANKTLSGSPNALNFKLVYESVGTGWRVITEYDPMSFAGEVKSAAFNAVAFKTYYINGSTFTVTLPTPTVGDWIRFVSAKNDKTAITFDPTASYKIHSGSNGTTWVNNGQDWDILFCYVDATIGWQIIVNKGYCKTAPSISTNTLTLDMEGGLWPSRVFEVSLNANITTLTINNAPASGMPWECEIVFAGDGTQRTITLPAAVKTSQGVGITPTATNGKKDRWGLKTTDGGTTWWHSLLGVNL